MNARRLARVAGLAALAGSASYLFVYLYRWEWNRALIAGCMAILAEVLVLGAMLTERLIRIERRLDGIDVAQRRRSAERVVEVLAANRPDPHNPFAWLDPSRAGTDVFIPVLMGAGVVLSALAWVVERLARITVGPGREKALARDLGGLSFPEGGFLADASAPAAVELLYAPQRVGGS
jgi:hypothetical protein